MMQRAPRAMQLVGIGWYFVFVIVGGTIGGVLLDGWLGTKPAFTLIGLFGGLVLAFWGGYLMLMEAIGKGIGTKNKQ
ncbi:MAG: AtpZ/AtpI family protein [Chloroflexota bacterium]